MKTNELIEEAKKLGYTVTLGTPNEGGPRLFFYLLTHSVAHVAVDHHKDIVIVKEDLVSDDLFLALIKYTLTPKEEREETVYYRLLLDAPAVNMPLCFCKNSGLGGTNLNVWRNGKNNNHLLFTDKELEKIDQKGFVKEPMETR